MTPLKTVTGLTVDRIDEIASKGLAVNNVNVVNGVNTVQTPTPPQMVHWIVRR
ncbi:MAG: hypothetical protein ACKO9Q_07715 [Pirellula sp.]